MKQRTELPKAPLPTLSSLLQLTFCIACLILWSLKRSCSLTAAHAFTLPSSRFVSTQHLMAERLSDVEETQESVRLPQSGSAIEALQKWKANCKKQISISALIVPAQKMQTVTAKIKKYMLKESSLRPVLPYNETKEPHRMVLLDKTISEDMKELPEEVRDWLEENEIRRVPHELEISYESMTAGEVLQSILPTGIMVPTAFETIGHIARLNLNESQLPYSKLIGQVILEKHKGIRTVINKSASVQNEYRTLDFNLLAGEEDYIAILKEHGFTFYIDFKNVFWNSRLNSERERLTEAIPEYDIICDVFAGVGAFAMYLGRRNSTVFANDLNPACVECLKINVDKNKLSSQIAAFCMDGGDFIKHTMEVIEVLNPLTTSYNNFYLPPKAAVHFIMHLPASAITFLKFFSESSIKHSIEGCRRCFVHCYSFARSDPPDEELTKSIESVMSIKDLNLTIRKVRDVSPTNHVYCIEFVVPLERMSSLSNETKCNGERDAKRICVER